nr:MAG TPA: hypothetical protein [Inoviridae sp.]
MLQTVILYCLLNFHIVPFPAASQVCPLPDLSRSLKRYNYYPKPLKGF